MKKLIRKHFLKLLILAILLIAGAGREFAYRTTSPNPEGTLEVHCIDVGQGDSTLIVGESQVMLIDAAEREYSDEICQYLTQLGVKKIDFLVATHPHDDHIGGMADVMSQFSIGCLVLTDEVATTNAYENMIATAQEYQIPTLVPQVGDTIPFADAECTVLGPLSMDQNNGNNNSMIVKITYGENKFLFMGDAERQEERELADGWADLSADFLRTGHHGSDTSSHEFFLARVMPQYAVISCGINNRYNHPSPEALDRLNAWCSEIFRTDLEGTVVVVSDGKTIQRKE